MDRTELNLKLQELETKFNRDARQLKQMYALANCPYEVGDWITTKEGKFKIKSINPIVITNPPQVMFICNKLDKDNMVGRNPKVVNILQEDVIKGVKLGTFNNKKL